MDWVRALSARRRSEAGIRKMKRMMTAVWK